MSIIGKKGVVVRQIPRAASRDIDALARSGVATVHEAQGRKGLLDPAIRPIQQDCGIAGSAVTVLVAPGDNWMFHVAVELCQPGDVLVVAPTSPVQRRLLRRSAGDLIAVTRRARAGGRPWRA